MDELIDLVRWGERKLLSKGYYITSPPTLRKKGNFDTPWSQLVRYSTSKGYFYLKKIPTTLSFEPKIITLLHDKFHAHVPLILDSNTQLNCFLMKDAGIPLRQMLNQKFNEELLNQAYKYYAELQINTSNYLDLFFSLGVPDWRLRKLPILFQQLIDDKNLLNNDHISVEEIKKLSTLTSNISDLCLSLEEYKIPETLSHSDFDDNNILIQVKKNTMTLIDWGFISVSHPFISLSLFLRSISFHYKLLNNNQDYVKMMDACLKNWLQFENENNLLAALKISKKLMPIYSALSFYFLSKSSNQTTLKSYPFPKGWLSRCFREFIEETA